ncbi:hypothetical protein GCM10025864_26610 [Luteimicrobium album]|uniref:Glycosyltransferase RgtA/B/C/D-like domain-containing protein n=2 Tax=Luteimicrobium album TaxID=1054550 RepID=A0ABQ6I3T2_9MICO|nr:hypothetical protein GCM10025864_26610 [Luteimicrobium album]
MPVLVALLGHMDLVHGFWYVVVQAWTATFGDSVVAVRILSAVFTGCATAGVVVLGAVLAGRRLAVASGFAMLVLPVSTGAAIEARSEAFVTALATWTAVAFVLAVRERKASWWILYACGIAATALAFVQSLTLVVAHALVLLAVRPSGQVWRRFTLTVGCALAALAPFVVLAERQKGQIGWVEAPTAWDVARTLSVHEWFGGQAPFAAPAWLAMAAVVLLPWGFPLAWRSSPVPPRFWRSHGPSCPTSWCWR